MRQIESRPIWIGSLEDLLDPRRALSAGAEAIVELADSDPFATLPRDLIRCRFPLSDGGENPAWVVQLAIEAAVTLVEAAVPTLVCCNSGLNRSVCLVSAAVAISECRTFQEALQIVVGSGPADVSPGLVEDFRAALKGRISMG